MKEGTCVQIGCRGVRRTRTDIEHTAEIQRGVRESSN